MEQGGAVKADSQAKSGSQAVARASKGTHRGTYGRIEARMKAHIEADIEVVARRGSGTHRGSTSVSFSASTHICQRHHCIAPPTCISSVVL